jgi:dephospho-CoA kinase
MLLTGPMGSGKGFVALYMHSVYGATRWTRTELMKRLAHAVKDSIGDPDAILNALFKNAAQRDEVRDELLEYVLHYEPEFGKARRLYQDITQICQDHDPLCFERELADRIKLVGDVPFSLVDDVRSRESFEFFKGDGFVTVRVQAPEALRRARMHARDGFLPDEATFRHISETALDDVEHDYVIVNDSDDVRKLYSDVDALMLTVGVSAS